MLGAGMTVLGAGMTVLGAGMTVLGAGMTVLGAGMTWGCHSGNILSRDRFLFWLWS
ncbi:hypothetical protein RS130_20605 [Paraglaciecola aquimarina]|uniref:Uncharacterized protein n=1 Tax=Paraglaciecola aquimarina TaxID=1235557 RepID=A0ABU3T158_9ALTE|nr:hypothetical protein [Paraglaciecola aquimarina]MDU0355970.1 hypothetical protein [Paraglaciecola aquimarina]